MLNSAHMTLADLEYLSAHDVDKASEFFSEPNNWIVSNYKDCVLLIPDNWMLRINCRYVDRDVTGFHAARRGIAVGSTIDRLATEISPIFPVRHSLSCSVIIRSSSAARPRFLRFKIFLISRFNKPSL